MPEPETPPAEPPDWIDAITLRAMEAARDRHLAWGGDARSAARAAREIARAHHPSLPMRMLEEAVAWVVPDPQGRPPGPPARDSEPLHPATPQEVAESLSYALRFGADGKPRRSGTEHLAPLAAAQLVRHLESARFVVMRRPPARQHPGY